MIYDIGFHKGGKRYEKNPIFELVAVTLLGVLVGLLVSTTLWEILLGPLADSAFMNEAPTEKLKLILTALLSVGIAMIYPVILLRRNIERRESAEKSLRESEKRFRVFTDNSPFIFSLKDTNGNYVLVNGQWEKFLGLSNDDVRGKPSRDVLPKPLLAQSLNHDAEVFEKRKVIKKEEIYPTPDGDLNFLTTKFPVFDEDGILEGIGSVAVDITERNLAVHALLESEKRLRLFTDAMPARFSYIDKDRRYRFCNLSYEKHFRKKREDIIGLTMEELLGPTSYEQVKPVIDRALSGETVFTSSGSITVKPEGPSSAVALSPIFHRRERSKVFSSWSLT